MRTLRAIAVVGAALSLSGCGFHALYADPHGYMKSNLGSIYVEPVPDRLGYELRNQLLFLKQSCKNLSVWNLLFKFQLNHAGGDWHHLVAAAGVRVVGYANAAAAAAAAAQTDSRVN